MTLKSFPQPIYHQLKNANLLGRSSTMIKKEPWVLKIIYLRNIETLTNVGRICRSQRPTGKFSDCQLSLCKTLLKRLKATFFLNWYFLRIFENDQKCRIWVYRFSIEINLSGNTVWPKPSFQKPIKWDFFGDFQTLCKMPLLQIKCLCCSYDQNNL